MDDTDKKHPATGYWMFVCNTSRWHGDKWLRQGKPELLYMVASHYMADTRPNQLGVIRFNDDRRSAKDRGPLPPTQAGVYAIVQTIEDAKPQPDDDGSCYLDPEDANKVVPRVRLKVLKNLIDAPVLASSLPATAEYQHFTRPLQWASIAITESVFRQVVRLAGIKPPSPAIDPDQLRSIKGVRSLEDMYAHAAPMLKEQLSKRIERGPVGALVKAKREGRCQVCEALGCDPVAFYDRHGLPFAEAHHVVPVSKLKPGPFRHCNLMVLCPNHHREAHYGRFDVLADLDDAWDLRVGDRRLRVSKTVI